MKNRPTMAARVAARWLSASYYEPSGRISVDELARLWREAGMKVYDHAMPIMLPTREVWPHREYTWDREGARSGYAKVNGKSVWLEGPRKWDALVEDMRVRGWDPNDPLHLMIGRKGGIKVGEGNHRLAIARELRLPKVPAQIHFYSERVTKRSPPSQEPVEDIAPKAVKKVVEKMERERPANWTPADEELLDHLMDLLGRRDR